MTTSVKSSILFTAELLFLQNKMGALTIILQNMILKYILQFFFLFKKCEFFVVILSN